MDASKKQREPVAFKSLAELKRFIRPGVEIKTVSHANHADMVGLTRVVTTVQTVGFYSKIKDQPEHPFSTCNHGKGFYTDFGKAGNYIFDGTTVKVKDARKQDRGVIYELEFYNREQNMEETMMDRKMVNFIKEQYPPGTRIRLNSMEDPYAPILPGTEGEVDYVDDAGQLHMKWDNGRSLALIPGEDSFSVLPPKLTTLKLYMPLPADLYERNEYGDLDDSSTLLEGRELRGYPENWQRHSYVACCGTSIQPVLQMLEQTPQLDTVLLCLDNDEAGHQASRRMREQLDARYSVERLIPENKDWNDDLTLSGGNAQGFSMNEMR